jgi:hypothetical protein
MPVERQLEPVPSQLLIACHPERSQAKSEANGWAQSKDTYTLTYLAACGTGILLQRQRRGTRKRKWQMMGSSPIGVFPGRYPL